MKPEHYKVVNWRQYQREGIKHRAYFLFWHEKYLVGGSTRVELEPDERSVWLDVLCLANRENGFFSVFERDHLARQLYIPRELLDRAISKFILHNKIKKVMRKSGKTRSVKNEKGKKNDAQKSTLQYSTVQYSNEVKGEAHFDTQLEFLKTLRLIEEELGVEHDDEQGKRLFDWLIKTHRGLDPVHEIQAIYDLWRKNPDELKQRIAKGKNLHGQLYALLGEAAKYAGTK